MMLAQQGAVALSGALVDLIPDISTAAYASKSFSVNAQVTQPYGVFFRPDGTKMFVMNNANDTLYAYSLSTAWDVSTASYASQSYNTSASTNPRGIYFKPDGTAFYLIDTTGDHVAEYSISTAWDITTSSHVYSFSVVAQEATGMDVHFAPDGTIMYIVGQGTDTVYQYTLSTAWDVSTASYASKSLSVTTQEDTPQSVFFSAGGGALYIVGLTNDTVYQYTLSTPWDVSTGSYASKSFSVASQDGNPQGIAFSTDYTKFYISGNDNNTIYQYNVSLA